MNAQPPRLARILLTLITPGPDRRFVRLDLKEEFDAMLADGNGLGEARRWYWKQDHSLREGSSRVAYGPDRSPTSPVTRA